MLANERLYAGLGQEGKGEIKGTGLIWNCDPITANSCDDFNNPGKTSVNALAVGAAGAPAGYIWAGLGNGIIWRCSLYEADLCVNWYDTGKSVSSISFDAKDGTTFFVGTVGLSFGRIYTCSTKGGCTRIPSNGVEVKSVAAVRALYFGLYFLDRLSSTMLGHLRLHLL